MPPRNQTPCSWLGMRLKKEPRGFLPERERTEHPSSCVRRVYPFEFALSCLPSWFTCFEPCEGAQPRPKARCNDSRGSPHLPLVHEALCMEGKRLERSSPLLCWTACPDLCAHTKGTRTPQSMQSTYLPSLHSSQFLRYPQRTPTPWSCFDSCLPTRG